MEQQQMIDGTIDTPTERVLIAGELYTTALYAWQALQKEADETRATLIALMKEDNIETFVVDSKYQVTRKHTETDKVTVKTIPADKE